MCLHRDDVELHTTFKFRPRLFGETAVYDLLLAVEDTTEGAER